MYTMDVTLQWVLCGTLPLTVRVHTREEPLPLRMTSPQCLSLWWQWTTLELLVRSQSSVLGALVCLRVPVQAQLVCDCPPSTPGLGECG